MPDKIMINGKICAFVSVELVDLSEIKYNDFNKNMELNWKPQEGNHEGIHIRRLKWGRLVIMPLGFNGQSQNTPPNRNLLSYIKLHNAPS